MLSRKSSGCPPALLWVPAADVLVALIAHRSLAVGHLVDTVPGGVDILPLCGAGVAEVVALQVIRCIDPRQCQNRWSQVDKTDQAGVQRTRQSTRRAKSFRPADNHRYVNARVVELSFSPRQSITVVGGPYDNRIVRQAIGL